MIEGGIMIDSALENVKKIAFFEYDFDLHGGDAGSIAIMGNTIPKGSIIKDGCLHIKDGFASGTSAATVGITALTSLDILGATALESGEPTAPTEITVVGSIVATKPLGTAATSILVTSDITQVNFVIGTEAMTSGKATLALEYIET